MSPSRLRARLKANKWKVYSWIIGIGFLLFAVHNPYQPLKEFTFLPVLGFALSMFAMLVVLQERRAEVTLGNKWIWIPLVVIVGGIAASGFAQLATGEVTVQQSLVPLSFGIYLFGMYLVARLLKEDLFAPFAGAVVIASISCVVWGLTHWGERTGGLVAPTNYDIAAGFLILGVLVSAVRRQWWLSAVALIGLCFGGAEEAMVAGAILIVVLIIRRDWGKRIWVPIGTMAVVMAVLFAIGLGQILYAPTSGMLRATWELVATEEIVGVEETDKAGVLDGSDVEISEYPRSFTKLHEDERFEVVYEYQWEELLDDITNWRWTQYKRAIGDFSWFGNGYSITMFTFATVHNVPLCIIDQVGPFAAVAWVFVTIVCLVKTKWRYLWTAVLALCLFDHYIFTQIAPWWWVFVGVTSVSERKSDLIFKEKAL